ncbi:MAG: N-acetylmuramoyl-L-alanine amidase family protein [Anaerolineae bacterium]
MTTKRGAGEADPIAVGTTLRVLVLLAFLAALGVPTGLLPIISAAAPTGTSGEGVPAEGPQVRVFPLSGPTPTPTPVVLTPTPHVPRVGIIAGHSGSDPGAVCPDGLQEVEVNLSIAEQVVEILRRYGWEVDLLEEFDVRLNGYQADALLSIHADSCNYPDKSGFKMARAESSYIPVDEDRLVNCVSRYYQARTGLNFDANTITYDMTRYHAYYEIDGNTPAAIIEVGFLLEDRDLLTRRSHLVAQGIAEGLYCFIEGEE